MTNLNAGPEIFALHPSPGAYGGRDDRAWEAAADARIDRHRKGDFTVVLHAADGRVVANRPVQARLIRRTASTTTIRSRNCFGAGRPCRASACRVTSLPG